MNYAVPYSIFFKPLSANENNEKLSKEVREINSEILEIILKDTQDVVEIEDIQGQYDEKELNKIDESKQDEDEYEDNPHAHKKDNAWSRILTDKSNTDSSTKEETKVGFSSFEIISKIGQIGRAHV